MFQLSPDEAESLRLQIATSKIHRGGRRYAPYAFTEQGIAMLSSVLRGTRAADVNVAIMRTFVRVRRILATNGELANKLAQHDIEIAALFSHVQALLTSGGRPVKTRPAGPAKRRKRASRAVQVIINARP
jgi:hypothetical protein